MRQVNHTTQPPTISDEERVRLSADRLARLQRRQSDFFRSKVNEIRRRLKESYKLSDARREGTTLDALIATDPAFKVAIADQQFANREAQMYAVVGSMDLLTIILQRMEQQNEILTKILEALTRGK